MSGAVFYFEVSQSGMYKANGMQSFCIDSIKERGRAARMPSTRCGIGNDLVIVTISGSAAAGEIAVVALAQCIGVFLLFTV